MLGFIQRGLRYFETLRHVRVHQLYCLVWNRLVGYSPVAVPVFNEPFISKAQIPHCERSTKIIDIEKQQVTLLNLSQPLQLNREFWSANGQSRLWAYHLHYFDYLAQADLTDHYKLKLIEHWIGHNPYGEKTAWEPYVVSLRLVNWVQFMGVRPWPPHWLDSLYHQYCWLAKNMEYHILANHFFENIKALIFASIYLYDRNALEKDRVAHILEQALIDLMQILHEQFLPDGGHYERSPMYHQRMLLNCIELLALLDVNEWQAHKIYDALRQVITKGINCSFEMTNALGLYPLFNDSVYQPDLMYSALLPLAISLGIKIPQALNDLQIVTLDDTGIYGFNTASDSVMMDCGEIGPGYQPGHTHCDFLSYEFILDRVPVVVDTGVFEYSPTSNRTYCRSTKAHNTVSLGHLNQSDTWGSFRVGRRAVKKYGRVVRDASTLLIEGAFMGFGYGVQRLEHARTIKIEFEASGNRVHKMMCRDVIQSKKPLQETLENRIHLHPDLIFEAISPRVGIIRSHQWPSHQQLRFETDKYSEFTLEASEYNPEFGLKYANVCIVIKMYSNCNIYSFERIEGP